MEKLIVNDPIGIESAIRKIATLISSGVREAHGSVSATSPTPIAEYEARWVGRARDALAVELGRAPTEEEARHLDDWTRVAIND